ncbi:DUF4383 domain-containing protein [Nocardiopsis sp. CNT312]|uniref:DUF4383 domain-containing protein n=1 Tax=Nocardiopsis sp. CNT312 TaxID=1137268 RepID=UPI0004B4D090|nr:DUF4383 domain-containing protein [Nocardiopsis sp. CNT312]
MMDAHTKHSASRHFDIVHRTGSLLIGLAFIGFGVVGLIVGIPLVGEQGEVIVGMSTDGVIGFIAVVIGSFLVGAAAVGGRFSSTVCTTTGLLFAVGGLANLYLMSLSPNILAFSAPGAVLGVVGFAMMAFGVYGRGSLLTDDPHRIAREWRRRYDVAHGQPTRMAV